MPAGLHQIAVSQILAVVLTLLSLVATGLWRLCKTKKSSRLDLTQRSVK